MLDVLGDIVHLPECNQDVFISVKQNTVCLLFTHKEHSTKLFYSHTQVGQTVLADIASQELEVCVSEVFYCSHAIANCN